MSQRPDLRLVTNDNRPDLYAGFGGAGEGVGAGLLDSNDERAITWSWPSFTAGALCGLVAGILSIAVPAIILVRFVL